MNELTQEQLDAIEPGWTFVPVDESWRAHARDYPKRKDTSSVGVGLFISAVVLAVGFMWIFNGR